MKLHSFYATEFQHKIKLFTDVRMFRTNKKSYSILLCRLERELREKEQADARAREEARRREEEDKRREGGSGGGGACGGGTGQSWV